MVISTAQGIEEWMAAGVSLECSPTDLENFQRLIEQLTTAGTLARRDEEVIMAAMVEGTAYSSEKCALFRQLQERVWRAELYLEPFD